MREYTTAHKIITFKIDGEEFSTISAVPAGLILDLADAKNNKEATEQFFAAILDDESLPRFMDRYRSRSNPIDQDTLNQIVEDIQEDLTKRPTELSSGSPGGSAPTEASSTGSAPTTVQAP